MQLPSSITNVSYAWQFSCTYKQPERIIKLFKLWNPYEDNRDRSSSVKWTNCGLDNNISVAGRCRDFSLLHSFQLSSRAHQPLIRWAPGALFPGIKRPMLNNRLFLVPSLRSSYIQPCLHILHIADCLLASSRQYLFDIRLLQYVQSLTPDDGRKDCPKQVECYSNKIILDIDASGWFCYRNTFCIQ